MSLWALEAANNKRKVADKHANIDRNDNFNTVPWEVKAQEAAKVEKNMKHADKFACTIQYSG